MVMPVLDYQPPQQSSRGRPVKRWLLRAALAGAGLAALSFALFFISAVSNFKAGVCLATGPAPTFIIMLTDSRLVHLPDLLSVVVTLTAWAVQYGCYGLVTAFEFPLRRVIASIILLIHLLCALWLYVHMGPA
jgi:hypothetical protein